jgi:peptide/nickel transport system substrate-binding protein
MREEDSRAPDDPLPPCGHRNPPTAHFCDVCGVKLPVHCPRCHAINRSQAQFCGDCGNRLRDVRRAHVTTSIAPFGPSPDSSPAAEAESASFSPDPFVPAQQSAREGVDASDHRDPFPRMAESAKGSIEDAERLEQVKPLLQKRRRVPPTWMWARVVSVMLGGVLASVLVHTYLATPTAEPPSVVNIDAKPSMVTGAAENMSAPVAQNPPASQSPGDPTIKQERREQPPAPRTPEESRSAAPSHARAGGELTFVVSGEPPSYDAHREETFALIHPAAPHYNTLLRIDPLDRTGTRVVGDLATSWTVSSDRRTYVLRLRRGVKFHDGSEMTSRDVRATYEKIINPPPGITSARKGEYLQIETVQAPESYVVAFKLKWPSPSFIHSLASPWNWIYKADILERDVRWYERNIMGTGPFVFVEHVKGSRWVGRRNQQYWDLGKPYLDGYQALFIRDDATQVAAIRSGRAHIQFRGFSPAQRDEIVHALGEKITEQASPWNCSLLVAINHEKWPLHDPHVRRALSLALDRYRAVDELSKTTIVREVAGLQLPGSPFATPPAELMKLAGYWRDIHESRSEARRLLAEAGVPDGFSLVLKNRDIAMPYQHIGTWLVDEWRQIGLNVRHEIQDSVQYFKDLRGGNFELSTDFQCGYVVDPDLDLYKFQSRTRNDANYGRYIDPVLDDLYVLQSRTLNPEQRRRHIRAFEKRLLDEEAHYIYTLQWNRIVPYSSQVRGWTITPSHYLNHQLDTVWLER